MSAQDDADVQELLRRIDAMLDRMLERVDQMEATLTAVEARLDGRPGPGETRH